MLDGKCSHPKKSLPGQVPFSSEACAAFTLLSYAATAFAFKNCSAFVMSKLIFFIIFNDCDANESVMFYLKFFVSN